MIRALAHITLCLCAMFCALGLVALALVASEVIGK